MLMDPTPTSNKNSKRKYASREVSEISTHHPVRKWLCRVVPVPMQLLLHISSEIASLPFNTMGTRMNAHTHSFKICGQCELQSSCCDFVVSQMFLVQQRFFDSAFKSSLCDPRSAQSKLQFDKSFALSNWKSWQCLWKWHQIIWVFDGCTHCWCTFHVELSIIKFIAPSQWHQMLKLQSKFGCKLHTNWLDSVLSTDDHKA